MNLPTQKRITILLSIIAALLLISGYVYIVYPSLDQINTLKSQIQVEKTFLKVAEKKTSDDSTDQEVISSHSAPVKKETDQIVLDLRKAETASKSEIQEITLKNEGSQSSDGTTEQPEIALSTLHPLTFSVVVTSPNLDSIQNFISTFEQSNRFYKVDSLDLTSGESDTTVYNYQLIVTTIYQK